MAEDIIKSKIYESVLNSVQSAINYCFLLNGSAVVAILTFVGNYKADQTVLAKLTNSILILTIGVFVASLSSIVLYMAQLSYFKEYIHESSPFLISGTSLRVLLLLLVVISVVLFGIGAMSASKALI
jgi:hypothetical protein